MKILRNHDEIDYVYATPCLYILGNYGTIQALSLRRFHKLRGESNSVLVYPVRAARVPH